MRAILLILIVAVAALILAVSTGLIDINQTRGARTPAISAANGGVTATGGQTPAFQIETGSVAIGSRDANVSVPQVKVERGSAGIKVPVVEVRRPAQQPAANEAATTNATN